MRIQRKMAECSNCLFFTSSFTLGGVLLLADRRRAIGGVNSPQASQGTGVGRLFA